MTFFVISHIEINYIIRSRLFEIIGDVHSKNSGRSSSNHLNELFFSLKQHFYSESITGCVYRPLVESDSERLKLEFFYLFLDFTTGVNSLTVRSAH